jgi:hypothetical protein
MVTSAFSDYYLTSFLYNSSFINQHFLCDYSTKVSHLDTVLLATTSSTKYADMIFYLSYTNDLFLTLNVKFYSLLSLFSSTYQDVFSLVLLFSPDLLAAFNDYFFVYYSNTMLHETASYVFDSYSSNLNYAFGEGIIILFLFTLFSWFIIYFFTLSSFLR